MSQDFFFQNENLRKNGWMFFYFYSSYLLQYSIKYRHPFQMVTMETEHFEPRVQTASPEIPPHTNQGQLAHLDDGFLQTITKASGGGEKKCSCIFSPCKRKYAENRKGRQTIYQSCYSPSVTSSRALVMTLPAMLSAWQL